MVERSVMNDFGERLIMAAADEASKNVATSRSGSEGAREVPADLREWLSQSGEINPDRLVEVFCADQLSRWRSGQQVPAEAYLALCPAVAANSEVAFELVYSEYLVRESLGLVPGADEFVWRFPQFADRLRRQLLIHDSLGSADGVPDRDVTVASLAERASHPFTGPAPPGFEVLAEIGRGSMSVVYKARQIGLDRIVALKVIRASIYADQAVANRFQGEGHATARLQHPNIIQVYEVGEYDGQGYLVLEYAPGGSLERKLAASPQTPRDAARLIEELAQAMHYAHQHGVIHRDIKPANVVLTEEGTPKITDFGLAKLLEHDGGMTRTGELVGTPCYMAPEQAKGAQELVGAATDVYALGTILYEALTGRPPFKGATPMSTLNQVIGQEPLAPGRLQRTTPRDLETICLKCLEKEPAARYSTARELADDLRRFREDRPIRARRLRWHQWAVRWCHREPVKAALLGSLIFVFVAGFVGVTAQWRRAEEKARSELAARALAQAAEQRAEDHLYFSQLAQAGLEWRLNNVAGVETILERCDPKRRGWEWGYLHSQANPGMLHLAPDEAVLINSVIFSPDGQRFAFVGFNPVNNLDGPCPVEVWDPSAGRRLHRFTGPAMTTRLSFSPDGRFLVAGGHRGAEVWDLITGQSTQSRKGDNAETYTPDGRMLASGSHDGVTFRDAATGKILRVVPASWGQVVFRPGGQVMAVSGPDAVELREVASGRELRRLPHGPTEPAARATRFFPEEGPDLAFSHDGSVLAVATSPPRIWDVSTGHALHQLSGHTADVRGLAFSPDDQTLATAGLDGTIRLWDVSTGRERSIIRGHRGWVRCLAFDPDGRRLLSGGWNSAEVILWDLTRPIEYRTIPHVSAAAFAFDQDGRRVGLIDSSGRLQLRQPVGGATVCGPRVELTQDWLTPATLAEYSADGSRLATATSTRAEVKVWDTPSGQPLVTLSGLEHIATSISLSSDGRRIAANGARKGTRRVIVWDAESGRTVLTLNPAWHQTRYLQGRVALSADGALLATDEYGGSASAGSPGLAGGRIVVRDVATGHERFTVSFGGGLVWALAFDSDGKKLAAATDEAMLTVWDATTGAILHTGAMSHVPFRMAFSPDSRRLATVDREVVRLFDGIGERDLGTLRGSPSRSMDGGFNPYLAWSPDGRWLASSNWDSSISVWDSGYFDTPFQARRAEADERTLGWQLNEADKAIADGRFAAAEFHFTRLRDRTPTDMYTRRRRGALALRFNDIECASTDFTAWLSSGEPADGPSWVDAARTLCLRGDRAGYLKLCTRLLESHLADESPAASWHVAEVLALAPGSCPDPALIVSLATRAVGSTDHRGGVTIARGLAHYRAGHWAEALGDLHYSIRIAPHLDWVCWPALALVYYRQGNSEEAHRWLKRAVDRLDERTRKRDRGPADRLFEPLWPEFRILLTEARTEIDRSPGTSKPDENSSHAGSAASTK